MSKLTDLEVTKPKVIDLQSIELDTKFPLTSYFYSQSDDPITRLHRHNCLELGYCHNGSGLFMVEDKLLPFESGDISIVGEEAHLARSAEATSSQWTFIFINPDELLHCLPKKESVRWRRLKGSNFNNVISCRDNPNICSLVRILVDEMVNMRQGYQGVCRGLVQAVLCRLDRIAISDPQPTTNEIKKKQQIAPALEYLSNHYHEEVLSETLALMCKLSPPHFRRQFLAVMSCSPHSYQMKLRIEMAKCLLKTSDKAVLEISQIVGFNTMSNFNRQFKLLTSTTPRNWRNNST